MIDWRILVLGCALGVFLGCSEEPVQVLPGDLGGLLDGAPQPDAATPPADQGPPGADASTAPPTGAITGVVKTFTLGASHTLGYGLAYDAHVTPHRLYAADFSDNKIYAYDVSADALKPNPAADIDTKSLGAAFTGPRGLATARVNGARVLFALTSADPDGDKSFSSRLWKVTLGPGKPTADSLDLAPSAFGVEGAEVFGLAYRAADGVLHISYDTSKLASATQQVRRGILRLRVGPKKSGGDHWADARAGAATAVAGHIPHSGRKTSGSKYLRAPAFGLALGPVEGRDHLFGTSYNKYLYAADVGTGRGLFHWWSPGNRYAYGLAFGAGHLWVLDRVSGPDRVHKVRVAGDWGGVSTGQRHVRRLTFQMKSTAFASSAKPTVTHNFGLVHPAARRPAQGVDEASIKQTLSPGAKVTRTSYDPAGDKAARQEVLSVTYSGSAKAGDTRTSRVEMDFWSSDRRHHVYPHRASTAGAVAKSYLADHKLIYGMHDTATYDKAVAAVKAAITAEYGAGAAASTNPYWVARDIMEVLLERYDYGNVSKSIKGHYSYNPANKKLDLWLDGVPGNEKMSCSTSTFAMSGMLRYQGIPTRWVGTTKLRSGWDKDDDGFRGEGEGALDTSFHRWPEVWLGPLYGWQRFDPTPPSDGPRELSQYELMAKAAQGVRWTDLVLTVGAGYHEPFFRQKDNNQRYNMAPRYTAPMDWIDSTYRHITWSNPCTIKVTGPAGGTVSAASPSVTWQVSGRWDLDPKATLTLSLQEVTSSGKATGSAVTLASGVPFGVKSKQVSLSGKATKGKTYRVELRKDGDSYTGAAGAAFTYAP